MTNFKDFHNGYQTALIDMKEALKTMPYPYIPDRPFGSYIATRDLENRIDSMKAVVDRIMDGLND